VKIYDDGYEEFYISAINSFEQDKGLDKLCDSTVQQYATEFERLFSALAKIISSPGKSGIATL